MMSRSSKIKNRVFNINLTHLLCLVPLILFSYYKNGILVYKENYISFFSTLEYLVIPILIVVISYLFEIYYYVGIKKERDLSKVVNSFSPYANLLCYLLCGPSDALYIIVPLIFIIDIIMKCIDKKVTINRIALFKCLLFILLALIGKYYNANLLERIDGTQVFTLTESFVGFIVGEMGTVSNLFILLSFIVLLFNKYYKKDIALITLVTYILFSMFFVLTGNITFNEVLGNTLNNGVLFSIIFVLTLSEATPILRSGRIIYSILIGILIAFFVNIFNIFIGIYFVILVMSLISPLINRLKISVYK